MALDMDTVHTNAYNDEMVLVQIRDVPADVVEALKSQAAQRGVTLAGYLRVELTNMANRPTNAEVIDRIMTRERSGVSAATTVAAIREIRDSS